LQIPKEVDEDNLKYYCTLADSNGRAYHWDTRKGLYQSTLLSLFPEAIGGEILVLDGLVILNDGGFKLEPTKKYVVPVPLV
jgi:hypothetical protein